MIKKILSRLRISRLRWHDLRSVNPVSRQFGFDRGTPIDRYYINKFLDNNRDSIQGRVLEVADSSFSRKYGKNITSYEVLNVEPSSKATLVGDLTRVEALPADFADCFICTQVFNFIYDFQSAIKGSYKLLKHNGVMLVTVSGISQISRYDADRWGHYWSFYPQGIEKAFKEIFGATNVTTRVYGNSLSAISFLKGLAAQELSKEELDFEDCDYPVTIAILAIKR